MRRISGRIAACALLLFCSAAARSQDSPSLGDVARQAQKEKDKSKKPPAKVITNEDLPAKAAAGSTAAGSAGQPLTAGNSATESAALAGGESQIQSPEQGMQKMQSDLDRLAALDRSSLALEVLGGSTAKFPGRAGWEDRLFAAKETFVAQTRKVLQQTRQIAAAAATVQDADNPNDPRVKMLSGKLQELVQESQQNGAAFQAVVAEGRQAAGLTSAQ